MARRAVKRGPSVSAKAGRAGTSRMKVADEVRGYQSEIVEFSRPRQLVTFDPGDVVWETRAVTIELAPGCIVRLRPPADATDETIRVVRDLLVAAGASAVKVLPRAASPVPAQVVDGDRPSRPGRTVRQVVMDRARESASRDHEVLLSELDSVLSEVGL